MLPDPGTRSNGERTDHSRINWHADQPSQGSLWDQQLLPEFEKLLLCGFPRTPPPPPVYIRAQVESPGTMTIGHYGGPAGLSESCAQDVTTSLFLARTLNPCLSSSIPVTRAPKKWGGKNSGFGRYRDRGFTPLPALAASDAPFPRLTLELPVCMVCLAGSCCHLRPSAGSSHGFILLLPGRRIIDVPHHHHHHHSPPQLTSANLRSPNQVSLIRVLPRFFMGL